MRVGGIATGPGATFSLGHSGGAEAEAVAANRRRLRARLALPAEPAWLRQVHGTDAVHLDGTGGRGGPAVADIAWTDRHGPVCAVMTADCLPVVLAAADGSAVAVAHAGWRGLAAGVLEAASAALPCPPAAQHVWLGPAIGPCHFAVGPEVRDALIAIVPEQFNGDSRQ